MFRLASRQASRQAISRLSIPARTQRFLSTVPPTHRSRSWKSSLVRWGAAAGVVYYYNTSSVFAEEPEAIARLDESIHHIQESNLPTLDAILAEKHRRQAEIREQEAHKEASLAEPLTLAQAEEAVDSVEAEESANGVEDLEEDAGQQGAFNPETGEINWDCPCLGGMAHGPCGEEFKEAFSCFVYSEEEPKGIECIEKFKGMQDCFRQHPEMYQSELEDDEDEVEEELRAEIASKGDETSPEQTQPAPADSVATEAPKADKPVPQEKLHRDARAGVPEKDNTGDEGGELIPRDMHDATPKE